MREDFVSFSIAKKLKEKGYTLDTAYHYDDNGGIVVSLVEFDERCVYPCPEIHQVLKWLRDEKKIFIAINIGYCYESYEKPFPTNPKMEPILKGYYYGIWELGNLNDKNSLSKYFEAPEQAALAGIEYVIDNLI